MIKGYLSSSIGKKQISALSGLGLVLFLIAHLAGNLLIYKGPEAFNDYAASLAALGPVLYIMRAGLIATFVVHILFTIMVVKENRKARKDRYVVQKAVGKRSFATKTMPITGPIILVYLILHLLDYTFSDHTTAASVINGVNLGLYGLVVNSFMNPIRAIGYVIAMVAIGMHLSHAIQSVLQTFGFHNPEWVPVAKKTSLAIGVVIAAGFASIPLYIFLLGLS